MGEHHTVLFFPMSLGLRMIMTMNVQMNEKNLVETDQQGDPEVRSHILKGAGRT